jgi:hypothetical protein
MYGRDWLTKGSRGPAMIRARKRRRVLTMGLRIGEVAMVGAEQVRRYLAALAGKAGCGAGCEETA